MRKPAFAYAKTKRQSLANSKVDSICGKSFEPRHEKTGFLHMRKQRHRSALRHTNSAIPLLSKSEISSL